MRHQSGFALFEAMLALALMMIAAAASYTLVKSFRANSSVQQFIRYATTITQGFMPFVDGNSTDTASGGPLDASTHALSPSFLSAVGIPVENQVTEKGEACAGDSCYVNSGMYLNGATVGTPMSFAVKIDDAQVAASYFIIAVNATGLQVNQVLQNASSMFSVYCPPGANVALDGQSKCALQSDAMISQNSDSYSLFLVFPKSGDLAPAGSGLAPVG